MRSTDEQLREIAARSRRIKAQTALRRSVALDALGACACVVLIAIVAITLPGFEVAPTSVGASSYGSLVLTGPAMAYAVIFVLAFLLGVCVALLAVHMRRMRNL